jgi:nucleoside phosphorylase
MTSIADHFSRWRRAVSERATARRSFLPPPGLKGRTRVAVFTIIEEEFAAAQKVFCTMYNIPNTPYFVDSNPNGKEWDLVLLQATDRTNLPLSGDVADTIEDLKPQILILLGVAGGLCNPNGQGRDGIGLGDVLIAEYVSYVEFLKITDEGTFYREYAIDHPSLPLKKNLALPLQKNFNLNESVRMVPPQPTNLKIHIGSILSGEKVFGGVENAVQSGLLERFDKALAVDMESIGMARKVCERRTSFWYHPRYAIIRGISDLVGPAENNQQRELWKTFAAHAAAIVAQEFVNRLPADERVQ